MSDSELNSLRALRLSGLGMEVFLNVTSRSVVFAVALRVLWCRYLSHSGVLPHNFTPTILSELPLGKMPCREHFALLISILGQFGQETSPCECVFFSVLLRPQGDVMKCWTTSAGSISNWTFGTGEGIWMSLTGRGAGTFVSPCVPCDCSGSYRQCFTIWVLHDLV